MSKELKRRGFRFVGPTVCYSLMQACGLVDDHVRDCFRRSGATPIRALLLVLALPAPLRRRRPRSLRPLPQGWPHTLQLGLTDSPGGAAALRRSVPLGFRYQYLAGGANTGHGLHDVESRTASCASRATWPSRGRAHTIPVFSYYMLLQSKPGGGDEAHADLANLRNAGHDAGVLRADLELFFERAEGIEARSCCTSSPTSGATCSRRRTGDDATTVPAVVPDGLPAEVAGFAQEVVAAARPAGART